MPEIRIHLAALLGLCVALAVAIGIYHMPLKAAGATTLYGAAYGLFPIGWIILNLIFLYQLTVKKGLFEVLRSSLGNLAPDPRIQVSLIAFSFGAFFEGAAGFGTSVAVTAAILIQLRFKPLAACGLSLIANTEYRRFTGGRSRRCARACNLAAPCQTEYTRVRRDPYTCLCICTSTANIPLSMA